MAYFVISNGLRGCYMPDSCRIVKVDTRRELRDLLAYDARDMKEAYGFGGSKREISCIAALAWRNRKKATLDFVIPFGREPGNYPFGLFVSSSTRADYLEQQNESN